MQSRRVLCASPAYLKRANPEKLFDDLKAADNCLRIAETASVTLWD